MLPLRVSAALVAKENSNSRSRNLHNLCEKWKRNFRAMESTREEIIFGLEFQSENGRRYTKHGESKMGNRFGIPILTVIYEILCFKRCH